MKSDNTYRIVAFGDIIGEPGRWALNNALPKIRNKYDPDLVVVNGENSAHGFGITRKIYSQLREVGVDVITGGNHIFQRKEVYGFINEFPDLLRPLNYPSGTPGHGAVVLEKNNVRVAVISLMGRIFMDPIDCPFHAMEQELNRLKNQDVRIILVDLHAEATSEKQTFGRYFDGRISAVWGTHTHTLTGDEVILPNKTAYISDIGMCGCTESILGMQIDQAVKRVVRHLPERFSPANEGPMEVNGVVIDVDRFTGKAILINTIRMEAGTAYAKKE